MFNQYLSLTINVIVVEQIYMMPKLRYQYQRIFICQLNKFYIAII